MTARQRRARVEIIGSHGTARRDHHRIPAVKSWTTGDIAVPGIDRRGPVQREREIEREMKISGLMRM